MKLLIMVKMAIGILLLIECIMFAFMPQVLCWWRMKLWLRSSGDYEDFINHDQQTVDNLFPKAQEFIEHIERILEMHHFF